MKKSLKIFRDNTASHKKRLLSLLCSTVILFSASGCNGNNSPIPPYKETSAAETTSAPLKSFKEAVGEEDTYALLLEQFLDDTHVPDVRKRFAEAIRGSMEAQYLLDEYINDDLDRYLESILIPSIIDYYPYEENKILYNIAMLYYDGDDYIGFVQDKTKAFEWFKLAAEKGNALAAFEAGEMAFYGKGVAVDGRDAFRLYSQAVSLDRNEVALSRLGDCYANGIGVAADRQKAFDNYLDSALMGYSYALYKLLDFAEEVPMDLTALYKAVGVEYYYGGYLATEYGGFNEDAVYNTRLELIEKLSDIWMSGKDRAANNMQAAVSSDAYFSAAFAEDFIRTDYSYSYHAFADKYILQPNMDYEDAQNIKFAPYVIPGTDYDHYWESDAERYLEYEDCQFYDYDFDGDGENEIGIPISSGTGMFSSDMFTVFNKTEDGLVYLANGPDCTFRDAMQIIKYDGKIYFLINWYDDPGNTPHDITAYTIDANGNGHRLNIKNKDYVLRRVLTYTDKKFETGYDTLLSDIEQQGLEAVAAFKQGLIYSPDSEVQLPLPQKASDWWSDLDWWGNAPVKQDIFFAADFNNRGIEKVIHKGHLTTQGKYYDDYHWFQIYGRNRAAFARDDTTVVNPEFYDDFYGLHSGGNLYDLLPVGSNVVQFWTYEQDNITYCVTLQKDRLLYTLQIYKIQNGETNVVSKSLFIDEATSVDVSFS